MDLEKEIFEILSKVGTNGLSVHKISIHVHNACNSLFETVDYDEVHKQVAKYLLLDSKKKNALVERVGKRGKYKLKKNSEKVRMMMQQYCCRKEQSADDKQHEAKDLSLDLFADC